MLDSSKRQRSSSPSTREDNDQKRSRDEQGNKSPAKNKNTSQQASKDKGDDMAAAGDHDKHEEKDVVDVGAPNDASGAADSEEAKEVQQHAGNGGGAAGGDGQPSGSDSSNNLEVGGEGELQPANIAMRALIVTGDASIIIGKQGKHINEIRDKSGARLTIVGLLSS